MRAVVQHAYGRPADVLRVEDVEPPAPQDDEVLVRMRAASLHADVWHVVTGRPRVLRLMGAGLRRPKRTVPGTDVAGVVEAVGARVTRFRPGDAVFGETTKGIQWANAGAFAELVAAPEEAIATKPAKVSFEEAAAVPTSGIIALSILRATRRIAPDDHVLVNGAGGGVGVLAVQIAKADGAIVTAVDHAPKLDMLRSIGADDVVDARDDYTARGPRYDVVFDVPGNRPFSRVRRSLRPGGKYVLVGHDQYGAVGRRWLGSIPRAFRLMAMAPFVAELPRADIGTLDKAALLGEFARLMDAGKLRPIVERAFPLDRVVDAFRLLESGTVRGKIVLTP